MELKSIQSRFNDIPAWALSVFAVLISSVFLAFLYDETGAYSQKYFYLFFVSFLLVLFFAFACYIICIIHPKSVWYTPVLCNGLVISSFLFEVPFWTRSLLVWIMLGVGLLVSVTAAVIGARKGRHLAGQG